MPILKLKLQQIYIPTYIVFQKKNFHLLKPKEMHLLILILHLEYETILIFHLVKERGFTLEGAKIHLKENKQKSLDRFDIIRKLEGVKSELLKIKEQL